MDGLSRIWPPVVSYKLFMTPTGASAVIASLVSKSTWPKSADASAKRGR